MRYRRHQIQRPIYRVWMRSQTRAWVMCSVPTPSHQAHMSAGVATPSCTTPICTVLTAKNKSTTTTFAALVSSRDGIDRMTSSTRKTTNFKCGALSKPQMSHSALPVKAIRTHIIVFPGWCIHSAVHLFVRACVLHSLIRWRYQQPADLEKLVSQISDLHDTGLLPASTAPGTGVASNSCPDQV